jgi:hypothetical protein
MCCNPLSFLECGDEITAFREHGVREALKGGHPQLAAIACVTLPPSLCELRPHAPLESKADD